MATRKKTGGWQMIGRALLLVAPFLLLSMGWAVVEHGLKAPLSGWLE